MTTYTVTLAVTTDQHLDDDTARDVAARWAADAGFDLGMTSTSRDEPWLRVSAVVDTADRAPAELGCDAGAALARAVLDAGAAVDRWETLEVLHEREVQRRARRPVLPPMVTAAELAGIAGVRVQRIYQLESERAGGKRADFPAPMLDGYWLRSAAEHWASTRRRKPGPAPRTDAAG